MVCFLLNKKVLVFLVVIALLAQVGVVFALGEECDTADANKACTGAGETCCCIPEGGTEGVCGKTGCNIVCPFSAWTSLETFIKEITDFIFWLAIVLAPLMMVIGGFIFLTSGGAQSRTTLGKNIMKWAIIGLAVILFAWGIQGVVKYIITGG